MPYPTDDRRRDPRQHRGARPDGRGRRGQGGGKIHSGGVHHGQRPGHPQGADPLRASRYKSNHNYRSLSGHDTGYNLRRGARRHGGILGQYGIDQRRAIFLIGAIALLVLLIVIVSNCARGCARKDDNQGQSQEEVNSYDSRVSAGVSESLTNEFTPKLDQGDKYQKLAKQAGEYKDERLPELALREPDALDFVLSVPDHEKKEEELGESVEKGAYPQFYDWDARWGHLDYGNSNVGVNGSGLTSMLMAYMGLTGKSDLTVTKLIEISNDGNYASDDSGSANEFFAAAAGKLGLTCREYKSSGENITTVLADGTPIIIKLNAGFTTPYAHWAVIVGVNGDGSITLYDPDSSSASTHTWAAGTVGGNSSIMYAIGQAQSETQDSADDSQGASTSGDASESTSD